MWLCLSDAFLSIVAVPGRPEMLKVRARCPGHIERTFEGVEVQCTPGRDYLHRAEIPRAQVMEVLSRLVQDIDYDNFKDSVPDTKLHTAYADVWYRLSKIQRIPPYSR